MKKANGMCSECGGDIYENEERICLTISRETEKEVVTVAEAETICMFHMKCSPFKFRGCKK